MVEVSIMHTSSTMKPPLSSSVWETNRGQPLAMFMPDFGFLKELLMGLVGTRLQTNFQSMLAEKLAMLIMKEESMCLVGTYRGYLDLPPG